MDDIGARLAALSRRSGRLRQLTGMEPTGDELLATSGSDGQAVWVRGMEALNELLSKERPEGTELSKTKKGHNRDVIR